MFRFRFLRKISIILFLQTFFQVSVYSQAAFDKKNWNPWDHEDKPLHFNPWELIIYRPENTKDLNIIRCWLKIEDENGTDITYSSKIRATYEWVSIPNKANYFQKKYYISGGMAVHLTLDKGKYRISVYTPEDQQMGFITSGSSSGTWESNVFEYDTENPLKVIFVSPAANQNGFYTGGWHIDSKAPEFWQVTKPERQ